MKLRAPDSVTKRIRTGARSCALIAQAANKIGGFATRGLCCAPATFLHEVDFRFSSLWRSGALLSGVAEQLQLFYTPRLGSLSGTRRA